MDEYISRKGAVDELQEKVFHNLTDEYYGTMQVLNELPAANVAPVVRCRDCKHFNRFYHLNCNVCKCPQGCVRPEPDGYCNYGERREE